MRQNELGFIISVSPGKGLLLVLSVSCLQHLPEVGPLFFIWKKEELMLGKLPDSYKGLSKGGGGML